MTQQFGKCWFTRISWAQQRDTVEKTKAHFQLIFNRQVLKKELNQHFITTHVTTSRCPVVEPKFSV